MCVKENTFTHALPLLQRLLLLVLLLLLFLLLRTTTTTTVTISKITDIPSKQLLIKQIYINKHQRFVRFNASWIPL